jgi:hypothetical protein
MSSLFLELRADRVRALSVRRFGDDLRANENWIARGLRLLGVIA